MRVSLPFTSYSQPSALKPDWKLNVGVHSCHPRLRRLGRQASHQLKTSKIPSNSSSNNRLNQAKEVPTNHQDLVEKG